jgi:type IV pilus assembly protein PilY1
MKRNELYSATRQPREPLIRRIARVLMPVVVATTTIQPLAYAAPNPSLLSQQPRFVDVAVDSNVAFIMDDSLSTEDIRLPVPAGLNPGEATGGTVTVRGAATGFASGAWAVGSALGNVDRNNEWIYRSSTLNPLYYNPAITYLPWNDNGRAGAAGNFTNAPVGVTSAITDSTTLFRFGVTPHDMRYVGPNYSYGNGNNFNRRLPAGNGTNAGANPPPVPSYLTATRAPNGGFQGVTDTSATSRNQDIFTSPMVLANGGAQQCAVATTSPTLTSPPSTPRGSTALPTSTRTTAARPSDPLPTEASTASTRDNVAQPTQARLTFARPVALASYTATVTTVTATPLPTSTSTASTRPNTPRPADTNRAITARPSSTPPTTNRTISTRPSTALTTSVRPSTPRATEYRQEQGVCGTWSAWTTTQPAQAFCSDPNSEGGVRVALIETRQAACPTGTTTSGSQCLGACPTGQAVNPGDATQCVSSCSGTIIGGQCYSACPTGTSIYGSNPAQCISDCTSGTPSGTQCVGSCGTGETLISGQCYSACPSGTTIHSTTTQCIATCPTGTTQTATQCLGVCPTSHPTQVGNTCYAACSGTDVVNPSNSGQCLTACPTGTTRSGSNPLQCLGTCPGTHPFQSGTQCYQNCPAGTRNPSNPAQCLTCPTGGNVSGTQCVQTAATCPTGSTLINGQCYAVCPVDANGNPTAAIGTPATQCRTNCPTGTLSSTTAICRLGCPTTHPTLSGTTCYAACPTGTTVSPSSVGQCLTNCSAGFTRNASNPLQCDGTCTGSFPTRIGNTCYGACGPSFTLNGAPASATQCISDCPSGQTVNPSDSNQCLGTCPTDYPTLSGTTCYANCPPAFPTANPSNAAQCLGDCPTGTTASGAQCRACAAGETLLASGQCCPTLSTTLGNCPVNRPAGYTCAANTWVPNLDQPAPARYYVFAPATAIANPTPSQLSDPANYVRVEINRDRPMDYPKASTRTDCVASTGVCTWDEEAQNFANWFTYYRTRLFSAVAVTSESLSNLTRTRNLDGLRLAYGSINYFPNGADPFNPGGRLPTSMTIDGQTSNGALVRGVRPFTEVTPPPAPGSDDRRQEVFDWLFSLRAIASTPNRESLDSVGRYFSRSDAQGPWIQPNGGLPPDPVTGITPATVTGRWSSNEDPADHITCRRNYTIMITDGEWTRAPWVPAAPQQPLVENTTTMLNALSQTGPTINGIGGRTYTYNPATDIQFSTNASSAGGTLSDIAFYYWSRDLRTDLTNSIRVVDPTTGSQGNPAFWQHMVPYLIGYGISATLDTDSTRQAVAASAVTPQAIAWPSVRLEDRATETATIVTDRDTAPIDCGYNPTTNPAGCGRVDDTLRAALAARGNFLAAADVGRLSQGVAAAFTAIGEIEGTATSLTGRSGTLQTGDRLFAASFRTNVWTGRVQSFDAVAYFQGLANSTTPPSIDSRFPAAASRNILTSSANGTAVAFPTGASDFTNLNAAQRLLLNNDPTLAEWLRGDQSREARNGGPFRNRPLGEIMGSIVNSQPFYSKAPDFGYQAARKPAADGSTGNAYRTYVNDNKNYRPARIYVGSNEGMLHAFDVSGTPATNSNYMNEVFAYVPRAVYGAIPAVASPSYVHRYLVDGPVVEGDVYTGGAWRTVIVGTTGAGPKGIFAIDATQRSGSTATSVGTGNVLWDITGVDTATNVEHLGHILQPGVIGSGKDGEWYYFVGNGYESQNDLAKLLAIRIRDGAITVVDTDSAGGNNPTATNVDQRPNGLGGVTPVYDANRNIIAIYAGDRLGRMWKFDLSSTNRSAWSSTQLFTATDPGGNRQPITAAPRIVPHPLGGRMVVFGTGRLSERNDISDLSQQTVYGVWEKNTSSPATVNKSTLRQFTLVDQVETTTNTRFRQLTGTTSLNWGTDNGWYFNLLVGTDADGERVVASPTENFGFVNITSFEPSTDGDPCQGGGRSFFYRLDVAGSFSRAPFAPTGPITNLPNTVAPNTVVGSELSTATVNQLQTLLRPATGTTNTSTTLSSTDTANLANRTASAATNPCLGSQAGGQSLQGTAVSSPSLSCPVAPLRTWRELPRNPR